MARRNWKRLHPTSLSHAMELCLEHARVALNLSVDRVADRMGLTNKWTLYKWIESGRIPAVMIRPFEVACGIDYVTRYLAHSDHKLLVEIPSGRKARARDVNELSLAANKAVGALMEFYGGSRDAEETLGALTGLMEDLAWHRGEVEKHTQPELALFEEEEP